MNKYFGIFKGHNHSLEDKYAEIAAENFGVAMDVMKREHHTHWALLLDADEFEVYKKKHPNITRFGGVIS